MRHCSAEPCHRRSCRSQLHPSYWCHRHYYYWHFCLVLYPSRTCQLPLTLDRSKPWNSHYSSGPGVFPNIGKPVHDLIHLLAQMLWIFQCNRFGWSRGWFLSDSRLHHWSCGQHLIQFLCHAYHRLCWHDTEQRFHVCCTILFLKSMLISLFQHCMSSWTCLVKLLPESQDRYMALWPSYCVCFWRRCVLLRRWTFCILPNHFLTITFQRQEDERFKRIDAKRGGRGFV